MSSHPNIDHLYRHHYGKMVAVLVRIFGLNQLENIEDAIQDTFVKAVSKWKVKQPENPEAWLTLAAKNRVIDLMRKLSPLTATDSLHTGAASMPINELFLEEEIRDSTLRMIFTACHPKLDARDQIVFSLKTISGFSNKEIAAALMLKEATVKKRIQRARKNIVQEEIEFEIPPKSSMVDRIQRVHQVLYLIFNEGFHANHPNLLVRQELCAEAIRLMQLMLQDPLTRSNDGYALLALMCFHAARIETKVDDRGVAVDLEQQDRTKWYFPLIRLGNDCMEKAVERETFGVYHYQAAIAAEHLKARKFTDTDWDRIRHWQLAWYQLQPSVQLELNMALVQIQLADWSSAEALLEGIDPVDLEQRAYLYYAVRSRYYSALQQKEKAKSSLELALQTATNQAERIYLEEQLLKI